MSSDLRKPISQIKYKQKNAMTVLQNDAHQARSTCNWNNQNQKSQHLNQYLRFFSISKQEYLHFHQIQQNISLIQNKHGKKTIKSQDFQNFNQGNFLQNLIISLQKEGFRISKQYASQLQIKIQRQSRYSKIVQLSIKLGYFISPNLVILNTEKQSFLHQEAQIKSYGSFGNVYCASFLNQKYAIKCLEHKKSINQNLVNCLKQYFFCLIFSALKIGPKIKKLYEFDIIVSKNCIQFCSQICYQISSLSMIKSNNVNSIFLSMDQIKGQLEYSLKTMHQLKIVHRDIKPNNIMYSRSLKKAVFIDYGGCDIIKQSLGFSTETYFIGTVGYCSQQMMKTLQLKYGFVDLYYNDLFGLQQTIKYFKFLIQKNDTELCLHKDQKNQQSQYLSDDQEYYCNLSNFANLKNNPKCYHIFLIKMQFNLWKKQVLSQYLWQVVKQLQENQQFQIQLLKFLEELLPSKEIQFLYNYLVKDLSKYDQTQVLNLQAYSQFTQFASNSQKINKNNSHFSNIYKILSISYSDLENWQKAFRMQLDDTEKIRRVILSEQNNFQLIKKQQEYFYFFELLHFLSMTDDFHQASIVQKTRACIIFLKIYQPQKYQMYKCQSKTIYSQNELLEPLKQTLEYLFSVGVRKIPRSLVIQFYLKLFDNRIIVFGYQFNIFQLFQQVYKLGNLSLKDSILLFWKIYFQNFVGSTYNVFYFSNEKHCGSSAVIQSNQFFQSFMQFYQKLNKDSSNSNEQQSVHNQNQQNLKTFIESTEYFFNALLVNRQHFSKLEQHKILQILKNTNNFQILSQKQYYQLKKNVQCLVYNEIYGLETESNELFHRFFNYMIRKNIINPFKRQLPFFITKIITFHANQKHYKQLKQLFQFYDGIISIQKISIRFQTSNRLLLAYQTKDHKMMFKITTFIINYFQSQNLNPNLYREINSMLISCQKIQFYKNNDFRRDSKSSQLYFTILTMLVTCAKRIMDQVSNMNQSTLSNLRKNRRQIASLIRLMYIFLKINPFLKIGDINPYFDPTFRQIVMKTMQKICKPQLHILNIYQIYLNFLDQYYRDNRKLQLICFQQLQTILQDIQFNKNNTQSKTKQMRFTLKLCKILAQIQFYNHSKNSYFQLIHFYNQLKNDVKLLLKFIKAHKMIYHLWDAHVYCQTSLNQKCVFLQQIIQILSQFSQQKTIEFYHSKLQSIFWCTCQKCYGKQTKYVPKQLVYHIYYQLYEKKALKIKLSINQGNFNKSVDEQSKNQSIYMDEQDIFKQTVYMNEQNIFKQKRFSEQFPKKTKISTLIYYFCLFNQYLSLEVRNFFLCQIKKNMKYLSIQILDIIQQKIYYFITYMIIQNLRINTDKILDKQLINKIYRKARWNLYKHYRYMRTNQTPKIIAQKQAQQFLLKEHQQIFNNVDKNSSEYKRKKKLKTIPKRFLLQFEHKMKRYRQVRQKYFFLEQDNAK